MDVGNLIACGCVAGLLTALLFNLMQYAQTVL